MNDDPTRYWEPLLAARDEQQQFTWLSLRALFSSLNDIVARGSVELVNDTRQRWVAAQRAAGIEDRFPGLIVDETARTRDEVSFLVLGDPGEADDSQYAVVAPLLAADADTAFMVICSDVVYPAGDVNDYVNAFHVPYAEYSQPIYALPGNHDWYDGLNGFMYQFCAVDPLPDVTYNRASYSGREWLARRLWRRAQAPKRARLATYRRRTARGKTVFRECVQPGPYFAIDTGPILVVAIDTGVTGELDREQGDWLRWIATRDKPKVLLTGKPIHVDNKTAPGAIEDDRRYPERFRYVDEIVRNSDNGFVAAIGGDVHNYQRYRTTDSKGRKLASIVSGGGGAYLSNTHRIRPRMADDDQTRLEHCYPSRAQSIELYAAEFVPALWRTLVLALVFVVSGLAAMLLIYLVDWYWSWPSWAYGIVGVVVVVAAVAFGTWKSDPRYPAGGAIIGADPRGLRPWVVWAGLFGVALALLAGWLLEGQLLWAALVWGVAVTAIALVSAFDNAAEKRSRRLKTAWWLVGVFTALVVGAGAVVLAIRGNREMVALAAALMPVAVAAPLAVHRAFGRHDAASEASALAMLPIREGHRPSPSPYQGASTYLAAAGALGAVVLLGFWQPRSAAVVALVIATLGYLVSLPIVTFVAQRRSRHTVRVYILLAAAVPVVVATFARIVLDEPLLLRVPVATLCVLLAVAVAVACTYLVWLRAVPLLWNSQDRKGDVTIPEIVALLRRDGIPPPLHLEDVAAPPAPSSRTERIVRMVTPPGAERSGLHRFASEIFEPRKPPFYKSFLLVNCTTTKLNITAYGVTGHSQEAQLLDSVSISLKPRWRPRLDKR